jgi:hypothetical protein
LQLISTRVGAPQSDGKCGDTRSGDVACNANVMASFSGAEPASGLETISRDPNYLSCALQMTWKLQRSHLGPL